MTYDKNGREVLRKFGNGTSEETLYDRAGRVTVKMQKDYRGQVLWGEGYVYGTDGKRTATVDNSGRVTFYEYNSKGQLSSVYYPYTPEMETKIKTEAETNGLPVTAASGQNRFLTGSEKSGLVVLLNSMQYGLAYNLSTMQVVIKESYEYDGNGNRVSKITPYGKIEYTYDSENCLLSSGSRGQSFVNYTYDAMGNLLTEESTAKSVKYAYNAENRMIYCEVTDKTAKEYAQTTYAYDAFGRRILVQDKGETALRTLYDGFTFDVIKQSPTFENGLFTDSNKTGIRWSNTGRPTGDRYRYLGDETKDENRYIYLDDNSYKSASTRYRGERSSITVNSTLAAQTTSDYGTDYFATDLLGSVSAITASTGSQKASYTYDAFGSLITGDLSSATDFGYLGKQLDPTTSLYNYGYRDYHSQLSRFITIDPIRDGPNWFQYCNSDPVNFVDLWGLCDESKSYEWINHIPPQYQSVAREYVKSQEGNWEKNGEFKEKYVGTPINNGEEYLHNGEDYRFLDKSGNNKTVGQPVKSLTNGVVVGAGQNRSNPKGADPQNKGNWVRIKDSKGWNTDYYHLDSVDVKVGDNIRKGQAIGKAGNTGGTTGAHLHVDQWTEKKPVDYEEDPEKYLKKSYDEGKSNIYFKDPDDYK